MELTQLLQFKAIAEHNNVSRAAQSIHISQSALSQSLAKLEAELGVNLFDHAKNRIVLNDTGKVVLMHVNHIVDELEQMKCSLERQLEPPRQISICSNTRANLRYTTLILSSRFPGITVNAEMATEEFMPDYLLKGFDFGFSVSPINRPEIASIFLGQECQKISVPRGDKLFEMRSIPPSALHGRAIILPGNIGLLPARLLEYLDRNEIHPRFKVVDDDMLFFSYFQTPNNYLIFTGNVSQKYRSTANRKAIPLESFDCHLDIWLCYLKTREQELQPFTSLIRQKYSDI